jgi:1D-myo-inositol 3-kinase
MTIRKPIRPACLVVGHITHDRYGREYAAGGSALYAAHTLRALGGHVTVATAFGEDFQFHHRLTEFDVQYVPSKHTTVFENTYPDDGPRLMLVEHPAEPVVPTVLPASTGPFDLAFLAPVIGEVLLADWVNRLPETTIVGVGLQGFLKQKGPIHAQGRPGAALVPRPFDADTAVLKRLRAVFLSEEDLDGYGSDDLLTRLRQTVPVVAVTSGEAGATIYEGDRAFHTGIRETTAMDPTGAGDTFAAGFLFGLAAGESPRAAARLGAAAASIAVEGIGPETIRRVGEAVRLVDQIPVTPYRHVSLNY